LAGLPFSAPAFFFRTVAPHRFQVFERDPEKWVPVFR
jgi:hypothetical protein